MAGIVLLRPRPMPLRLLLPACLVLSTALVTHPCRGQEEPSDETGAEAEAAEQERRTLEARALFAEGVAHTQSQTWPEAAEAFRAALALREAPAIRYNLAAALVELGGYREAQLHLDAIRDDEATSEELQALTEDLSQRLRREGGRLSIQRSANVVGAEVTLDDDVLDDASIERELIVAPGAHVVRATRAGESIARAEVEVAAGEHTRVYLGVEAATILEEPAPVPLYEEWAFWTAIGAGVVVLAVLVGIIAAVAGGGDSAPVAGNFNPGIITWP